MITSAGLRKLGFIPEVDFRLVDNGTIVFIEEWWSATPQPSNSAIETASAEAKAEYDSQAYARNRASEYPLIVDQLDDIFHNGIDGWKATIQVTKDKYPKE